MGAAQTFGRYELLRIAGSGGMAQVHLARQLGPEGFVKPCVLKRIAPAYAHDETVRRMFLEEARISALLNHPNIVQTFDYGEVDGVPYLAMELVDGVNLAQLCRTLAANHRWLPLQPAIEMVAGVLDALDYAHNLADLNHTPLRLVHRDVSPQNTLLSRQGVVKLSDFGIAHHEARETLTLGPQVKGKPGYMAPEQAMQGSIDGRTDLFAVGIMLAELISARRVLGSQDRVKHMLDIGGRIRTLCALRAEAAPELTELAVQLCALDPNQRPGSAREAAQRLRGAASYVKRSVPLQDFLRSAFTTYLPSGSGPNPAAGLLPEDTGQQLPSPPEASASDLQFEKSAWSNSEAAHDATAAVYGNGWPAAYAGDEATLASPPPSPPVHQAAQGIELVAHSSSVDAMQFFQAEGSSDPGAKPAEPAPEGPRRVPYVIGRAISKDAHAVRGTGQADLPAPVFTPAGGAGKGLLGFDDPALKKALSSIGESDPNGAQVDTSKKGFTLPPVVPLMLGGLLIGAVAIGLLAVVSRRGDGPDTTEAVVGIVEVTSEPAGGEVFVDGRATGHKTPAVLRELPVEKPLRLSIKRAGYQSTPPDVVVQIPQTSLRTTARFTLKPGREYKLSSVPSDATVSVNGYRLGAPTPLTLPIIPFGETATLSVVLDGHLPQTYVLASQVDTSTTVEITLEPGKTIEISSTPPGAQVWLDDRALGQTPIYEVLVPLERPFVIKIKARGYKTWRQRLRAKNVETTGLVAELHALPFLALPWSKAEAKRARDLDREFAQLNRKLAVAKRQHKAAMERQSKVESAINASVGDLADAQRRSDLAQDAITQLEQDLSELETQMDVLREQLLMRIEGE